MRPVQGCPGDHAPAWLGRPRGLPRAQLFPAPLPSPGHRAQSYHTAQPGPWRPARGAAQGEKTGGGHTSKLGVSSSLAHMAVALWHPLDRMPGWGPPPTPVNFAPSPRRVGIPQGASLSRSSQARAPTAWAPALSASNLLLNKGVGGGGMVLGPVPDCCVTLGK